MDAHGSADGGKISAPHPEGESDQRQALRTGEMRANRPQAPSPRELARRA